MKELQDPLAQDTHCRLSSAVVRVVTGIQVGTCIQVGPAVMAGQAAAGTSLSFDWLLHVSLSHY